MPVSLADLYSKEMQWNEMVSTKTLSVFQIYEDQV